MSEQERQSLADYSEDELLAEIVRRRNEPRDEQTAPWCDDCDHFKKWEMERDPPASFNPCGKKHTMQFWMPQGWEAPDNFGYYRSVCADRKSIHQGIKDAAIPPRSVPPKR